jgi:exodeoxyribonuclease VII large subunit
VHTVRRGAERLLLQNLQRSRSHLNELGRTLHAVSPLATMGRGYAVLFAAQSGDLVTKATQVNPGEALAAQLVDGRLHCIVERISTETLDPGAQPGDPGE